MGKPNASDFFDPAIQQAKFVAAQVGSLSEEELIAHGATKFAAWEINMDANAVLKSLERIVREDSIGKVFGDGSVFAKIPDNRTANVSFFKLEDGSGVAIAKLDGGQDAMKALLAKADMSDLDLMPKPPVRKEPAAERMEGKITINGGQELVVDIVQPKKPFTPGRHIPHEAMGGAVRVPGHNPVAMKAFLLEAWSAPQQSIPMADAANLAIASMMAATSEAHPEDDAWPEGITVKNAITGAPLDSPKRAIAEFDAAVQGREGPVIQREDLMSKFRSFREGAQAAGDQPQIEAPKPRAPGM